MLVFAKEDAQSDGFWWAADKGGYKCNIVRNPTDALDCFVEKQHDVVIIDHRTSKGFDAIALCRYVQFHLKMKLAYLTLNFRVWE